MICWLIIDTESLDLIFSSVREKIQGLTHTCPSPLPVLCFLKEVIVSYFNITFLNFSFQKYKV
jgi:hypothetical protein